MASERTRALSAIPDELRRTITSVHGQRGDRWLAGLEDRLERLERRWNCRITALLPGLTFNIVYAAKGADGQALVLKLGVPCREISSEIRALRSYAGQGAVTLVHSSAREGALLEARLLPGTMLSEISDEGESLRIFADVYRRLRRPGPAKGGMPTLSDWGQGMERMLAAVRSGSPPFPLGLAERGAALHAELIRTTQTEERLHGDLHHFNIINGERGWAAIDPKGVVGDPHFDVVAFLLNCLPQGVRDATEIARDRISFLARETSLDGERILAWLKAHSVLSAWWTLEDGVGDTGRGVELAEELFRDTARVR